MFTLHTFEPFAPKSLDEMGARVRPLRAISGCSSSYDPRDFKQVRSSRFLVSKDATGEFAGCGGYRGLKSRTAEIELLLVLPDGGPAGAHLVRHLQTTATAEGYEALWLHTLKSNMFAAAFLKSLGFRRIPNYGKHVDDAGIVSFERRLVAAARRRRPPARESA